METGVIDREINKIRYNRHRKRKNNLQVAAMYAMYNSKDPETGRLRSLASVALAYKKTRQAVYDLFRSRGYPLRTKKLEGRTEHDGIIFTFCKGGYLRGSWGKRRILMHQYVWEKANGPISPEYVLHHIDGNRTNNSIENLELVRKKEMSKKFNPKGNNQFIKDGTKKKV